jgi:hypothetical protein
MVNITVYDIINDKNCQKVENNMTNYKVQYLTTISSDRTHFEDMQLLFGQT